MTSPFTPGAGLSGALSIGEIFLYSILGQILGAAMAPLTTELQQFMFSHFPDVALTPAELTDGVIKGHLDLHKAIEQAGLSGIDEERLRLLIDSAGEPPGLEFLLEAFRRGFIAQAGTGADSTSLEQGIRESRLKNKWISLVERMRLRPIGIADAVDAVVESQIPREQGERIAYENGISAEDFTILFNTRGQPPTPGELIELVRRGIIPIKGTGPDALSLQQGIFEGATKNKWEPGFEVLTEAVPPPRTVTALLRSASITDAQAARWFRDAGLSAEAAAAYVANAHHGRTASHKELAVGTVLDLYEAQFITAAEATKRLADIGWSAEDSAFVLGFRDLQREIKAVNAATARIGKLYIARKIDKTTAVNALNGLHIPDPQVTELVKVWDQERALDVKTLTEGQIVAAWRYEIFDQATAQAELQNIGYTAFDAWALLSIRNRSPLPAQPAR